MIAKTQHEFLPRKTEERQNASYGQRTCQRLPARLSETTERCFRYVAACLYEIDQLTESTPSPKWRSVTTRLNFST